MTEQNNTNAFMLGPTSVLLTVPLSTMLTNPLIIQQEIIILGGTELSYRMANFPFFLLLHLFDVVGAAALPRS